MGSQVRRYQSIMMRRVPRNRVVHGIVARKKRKGTVREHRKGARARQTP